MEKDLNPEVSISFTVRPCVPIACSVCGANLKKVQSIKRWDSCTKKSYYALQCPERTKEVARRNAIIRNYKGRLAAYQNRTFSQRLFGYGPKDPGTLRWIQDWSKHDRFVPVLVAQSFVGYQVSNELF